MRVCFVGVSTVRREGRGGRKVEPGLVIRWENRDCLMMENVRYVCFVCFRMFL